ncbi:MAG TPA: N-acetylmuramoyl-L-alanine amidase [Caulobacteraceae bacterium]|nr:N-acetylmuramoyl-L-alanine amidase [Caulobacteraceae bacterium]
MSFIQAPSPNFDARVRPPDMIVLHYTGMPTGESALAKMCDADAKVSAHYMVEEDGRIFSLVPEERRAWHAGKSFWKGETDINAVSIGIEIVNPGHEFGYRAFPDPQVEALIDLIADVRSRWTIPDARILGHADVAPARKEDPGELFPWKQLAEAGHGLWVESGAAPGAALAEGEEGLGVLALQAGLTRLGYDCAPSGKFDPATTAIVRAFHRHWLQTRFDGVADGETRARLVGLLRLAG